MSFPRYDSYKDSGVGWLGEVPAHWMFVPGRRLFEQRRDPSRPEDEQLTASQKYGVVPQSLYMVWEDQKVTLALSGLESFKHVDVDDFVISLRSFQGGIEWSRYSGCVSPAYTVLRRRKQIVPDYWAYTLKCPGYISALQSISGGIRDGRNISYEQFGSIALPQPPHSEQRAIAAFLDRETAKIDALVAEQQRLIELLKEKRQAVISHAVTKGLNPDVPMKDSDIEWLGEVPAHWSVTRVKYLCSHVVDCLHTTPTYDGEPEFPAIRTADVERGRLLLEQSRLVSREVYEERIQRLQPREGDVLYSREGERFGMAALVPPGIALCLGQRMMMFRARPEVHSAFLMWLLNGDSIYKQVLASLAGATSPHVNIGDIINFHVPLPTVDEQRAISAYIDRSVEGVDALISEADKAMVLLGEHRSALISAAVTGRIDVRGLAQAEAA